MLFDRRARLQIGLPGTTGKEFLCGGPGEFRLTFDVKMSATGDPNTGTVELYNVNPATIALAQNPECEVRLLVGYGDVQTLLFVGNPIADGVSAPRRGPDRVLHIEAADGGRAYGEARCSISMATATTAQQVFDEIIRQTGLALGVVRVPSYTFQAGYIFQGQASDALAKLASACGATTYTRDGGLVFIEAGGDTGEQAVVYSGSAGNLIGSPTPKAEGKMEVKALLSPTIRPGKVFSLESLDYSGLYIAEDVGFKGDTHGQDWYVTVIGVAR